MITIRYGPLPDGQDGRRRGRSGERRDTLQLDWPEWELAAPLVLGTTQREYVARVRDGSFSRPLGSDPSSLTIALRYHPYLRKPADLRHWAQDLIEIVGLQGRYVDMLWGDLNWGEWRFHSQSIPMDVFGIVPAARAPEDPLPQGMYPKQIDFSITLRADAINITVDSGAVGVTNDV